MSAPKKERFGRIDLRVKDLDHLFASMDPAPFLDKDLDQEAEDYIRSWAAEYPPDVPLKLFLQVTEPKHDIDYQAVVETSLRNFFSYRAESERREFRQLMARGRLTLLIGLCVLVPASLFGELLGRLGDDPLLRILRESLLLAGWVAMWRPIQIFLYDWWPIRRQVRSFDRLAEIEVELLPMPTPLDNRRGPASEQPSEKRAL